ncbi:MAG: hypothetical protein GF307_01550 [candidate division Zixibacteria bacterium]|nr:hypothetical protein [candidate division Zixibacteria bacterium]
MNSNTAKILSGVIKGAVIAVLLFYFQMADARNYIFKERSNVGEVEVFVENGICFWRSEDITNTVRVDGDAVICENGPVLIRYYDIDSSGVSRSLEVYGEDVQGGRYNSVSTEYRAIQAILDYYDIKR